MSPAQLEKIIEDCPDQIQLVLREQKENILKAAAIALENSQDSKSGACAMKVGLALKINLALDPVAWEVESSVSTTHKVVGQTMTADTTPELMLGMGKKRKGEE